MAKSRPRGTRSAAGKGGPAAAARQTKATSRKSAATGRASKPAVAVVDDEPSGGMSLGDGIAIITGLMLVVAILMIDYISGKQYGSGIFFS